MSNHINPQRNEEELIINTGAKKYTIKDEHGRLMGELFWNPTDSGIISRYSEVLEYFNSIDLKDDEDTEEFIKNTDSEIIDKVSYLLNEDTGNSLFKRVTPLTMLANGNVYVLEVINKIGMLIEKESKIRVGRAKPKINKYTKKYHK